MVFQGGKQVIKFANTSISSLLFAVRASTVATAFGKSDNNLSTFCHYPHEEYYYYYYYYTTKNSSAMAQTTPKIRSFSLVNVSAQLSLKKLSFSTEKRN